MSFSLTDHCLKSHHLNAQTGEGLGDNYVTVKGVIIELEFINVGLAARKGV